MASNIKEAQRKASSPEARAKAVATRKRRMAEKMALSNDPLLVHAKITKGWKTVRKPKAKVQSIPLDMIPDAPRKQKKAKPGKATSATRQEVVLALLRYLNGE